MGDFDFVFAGNEEDIDYLQDTEGVEDEHSDEPPLLPQASGFPEGEALPDQCPDKQSRYDKRVGIEPTGEHVHGFEIHTSSIL